jgi:ankyrin repeat protein
MSAELFEAIERHELPRLVKLLSDGADPNAANPDQSGWRPLKLAVSELVEGGPIEAIVLLLQYGAIADGCYDPSGSTPLILAAQDRLLEAARLLLAAGANPNACDDEGDSPLRLSAERGDYDMAALLIAYGANQTINSAGGLSGMSALGWAVWKLDLPMVDLLMRSGADPKATDADRIVADDHLPPRTESNAEMWDTVAARLGIAGQQR